MEKKLELINTLSELGKLPQFVEEICDEMALGPDKVFNLNLVLEEALTNVIMYAYPQGEEHAILVDAKSDDKEMVFTITDTGIPFDPTEVPDADVSLSAEEREIGGLGIFLIRQIMNRVEYQRLDDKNILTMAMNL